VRDHRGDAEPDKAIHLQGIADPLFPLVFFARCPRASRKAIASVEKTTRFTTAAILIEARITG
jgi:hypothetical protein